MITPLHELFNLLRRTNSTVDKVAILKRHDNKHLRKLLSYAYDPNKTYHLKCSRRVTISENRGPGYLSDEEETILKLLNSGKLSGNNARDTVKTAVAKAGDTLLNLVINKNLECGMSATTINKAFPGLIATHKVQLAKEVKLSKVQFPCVAQLKYDGVRLTVVKDGEPRFYTRNGKEANLPLFKKLFAVAPDGVYDGEITVGDGLSVSRTSVSGMINSSLKGGKINESVLRFNAFDFLTLEEWKTRKCNTFYYRRQHLLQKNLPDTELLTVAKEYQVSSIEQVNELYSNLIGKGYEGLILKHPSHLYTFKRSKDWVKIKESKTADLVCVNYEEGKEGGNREGLIGKLICEGIVEGKQVAVGVGSGLNFDDINKPPSHYIGKTIEILYNSVIPTSDARGHTLFLPRFITIRFDK